VKIPFWKDPNDSVEVLEATKEAADKYGHMFGSDLIRLEPDHVEALQAGKMLAWHDSEYSTFVMLAVPQPGECETVKTEPQQS